MAIANPRIHVICGICGCNKMFKYRIKDEINDDSNLKELTVTLICDNCSSITSLEELIEQES